MFKRESYFKVKRLGSEANKIYALTENDMLEEYSILDYKTVKKRYARKEKRGVKDL